MNLIQREDLGDIQIRNMERRMQAYILAKQ